MASSARLSGDPGVVSVGIPVRDGARYLDEVLAAVRAQEVDRELELVIVDSGSRDGSAEIARRHGSEVVEIPPGDFSHGGTRNLIVERSRGAHVALLTQDATPQGPGWLARLLEGFELADDVGLVFGPYLPRPDASHMVRRELTELFASFAPNGRPKLERIEAGGRVTGPGPTSYFTSANGCLSRRAWEEFPFREVAYAEDQLLATEMLEGGWSKVFEPGAAVLHSHDYPPGALLRRCFDEWRGLREVYGFVEPAGPRRTALVVRGQLAADRRMLRGEGVRGRRLAVTMLQSLRHYLIRAAGSVLGSRADRLPGRVRRALSLEGRETFEPLERPDASRPARPES